MSWLDDDDYAADRAHLAERLLQKKVVLVVHKLGQGLAAVSDTRHFDGTALAGPTLPVVDLRDDGTLVRLAREGVFVANATRGLDDLESLFERLSRRDPFVLHLRGQAAPSLTRTSASDDDVRASVMRSPLVAKFLHEVVETRTLVTVGVDPSFLRSLIPSWGPASGPHYALLDPSKDSPLRREELRQELNLRILPMLPRPNPVDVMRSLRWLGSPHIDRVTAPTVVAPSGPPRIEEVRLQQIGPYEELSFLPSPNWSVLLGALGLLGDDPRAQPVAVSLLRVGATKGAIELRIGGREFRTELYREGTAVHVRTTARSPLQALKTTMLGFPALRGGAVGAASSPFLPEPNAQPDVGDLLPLVHGSTDPRIATVRQWIAQTRLRAELERARNPDAARRLDATLERFFAMMVALLPGLSLRLGRIEPTTGQVWVITDAGEVPLDALSQGTTAVLGWIGTLLLRLLETHPDAEHPEREHAVVLADEIDAHMHPEWQQALVGLVRAQMPNLQVIATSHSPLVVGSLGDGKVFRVPRLSEAKRVTLEALQEPFAHYRADQILTSAAFGLDHTTSKQSNELLDQYAELHAKTARTPEEEARYIALRTQVREEVPSSPETPEARAALEAVEKVLVARQLQNPQRALENAQALLARLEKEP
jgi:hypothetical protein